MLKKNCVKLFIETLKWVIFCMPNLALPFFIKYFLLSNDEFLTQLLITTNYILMLQRDMFCCTNSI